MKTLSHEDFLRLKKRIKTLDRLNKTLTILLVIAGLNLVLLFFGINLIEWGKNTALTLTEKWGPTFNELTNILSERASS